MSGKTECDDIFSPTPTFFRMSWNCFSWSNSFFALHLSHVKQEAGRSDLTNGRNCVNSFIWVLMISSSGSRVRSRARPRWVNMIWKWRSSYLRVKCLAGILPFYSLIGGVYGVFLLCLLFVRLLNVWCWNCSSLGC